MSSLGFRGKLRVLGGIVVRMGRIQTFLPTLTPSQIQVDEPTICTSDVARMSSEAKPTLRVTRPASMTRRLSRPVKASRATGAESVIVFSSPTSSRHPFEGDELTHGAHDRCFLVPGVELNHGVAGPRPGIADRGRQRQLTTGLHGRLGSLQVRSNSVYDSPCPKANSGLCDARSL